MTRKTRQNRLFIECGEEPVKLSRNLGDEEAFHFYASVGQPTSEKAVSLREFLEKTKTIERARYSVFNEKTFKIGLRRLLAT